MRGTYDTPKRSHVIKTRLDDEEYKFFLLKCKAYGMNQSEMIRTSLDKLVINPVIKFSPVNKELLSKIDELITEGKRIGNNLNQIARALNSGFPDQSIESEIRRALGDLAEWKYEILQEVGRLQGFLLLVRGHYARPGFPLSGDSDLCIGSGHVHKQDE